MKIEPRDPQFGEAENVILNGPSSQSGVHSLYVKSIPVYVSDVSTQNTLPKLLPICSTPQQSVNL